MPAFPWPPWLASDNDPEHLGAPFVVMHRVDGETIPRKLLRDAEFEGARTSAVGQVAEALARLHAIDPDDVDVTTRMEEPDEIERFTEVLDLLEEPHPAFELGFRWLAQNRPTGRRRSIVHGDFRNGNLLMDGNGLQAVLDWELAHVGDPIEDLGWFCVRAWRFGSPPSGRRVRFGRRAPEGVLGGLRHRGQCRGAALVGGHGHPQVGSHVHRAGVTPLDRLGPERGAGHRRSPRGRERAGPLGADLMTLYDRPQAPELVEAVREFLEDEVMTATEGSVRYQARVAVNALRIVERELAHGEEATVAHHERLASLGVADDAELAAAIRAGDFDDRWESVLAAVRASVLDKLAVAHPGYTDDAAGEAPAELSP